MFTMLIFFYKTIVGHCYTIYILCIITQLITLNLQVILKKYLYFYIETVQLYIDIVGFFNDLLKVLILTFKLSKF